MKAKTKELLYLLLWTCDRFMRPTFRNLHGTFEEWAHWNGLQRELDELGRQHFLETHDRHNWSTASTERVLRLTDAGRIEALGGRDPRTQWERTWDGVWRLVLFDVPRRQSALRNRLRKCLRHRGFGYLQGSVWISPDPLKDEKSFLIGSEVNVESLILVEARPCAGETHEEIVAGAWNFGWINSLYARHMEVLDTLPRESLHDEAAARAFHRWARNEQAAWLAAVTADPLLPSVLLPKDYLGRDAWRRRLKVIRQAARQSASFRR